MAIITVENAVKIYKTGAIELRALDDVTFSINKGEFVCIMGPSGSGKSTMMNILGCLDVLTSGKYILDGVSVKNQSKAALADIRNHKIGFVFQGYNLLPRMNALENVELSLMYRGISYSERRKMAVKALESVGLGARIYNKPFQMSGGQQQRVAIARAIVGGNDSSILMADEPTGALDTKTSVEIMEIFKRLHENGVTIILVTHEPDISLWAERVLRFRDGKIVSDEKVLKDVSGDNEVKR